MERRVVQACKGTNNSKRTMKQIIYILFLLLFLPQTVSAQSKPKRDTSKDRSVIVAKQKKEQAQKRGLSSKRNTYKKRTRHVVQRTTPDIQVATYLRVVPPIPLSKPLDSKGGCIGFDVVTDGKNWTISNLPYWCHVRKYSNRFVVDYDANTKHEDRHDWFEVSSDNQQVRINISQQGAPINIQAKFNYANLHHNQPIGYIGKHLEIASSVTISGAAGQKCLVVALIDDEDGKYIKAKSYYNNYTMPNSDILYVASEVIPSTDNEETFNVISYLPNNAMDLLQKNNNLQCKLFIFCVKTNEYVSGATYTMKFRAKSKRGVVTTK